MINIVDYLVFSENIDEVEKKEGVLWFDIKTDEKILSEVFCFSRYISANSNGKILFSKFKETRFFFKLWRIKFSV